jgi:hypothetical protein
MEDTDMSWRKASYSSNGGAECVEVADAASVVLVRDSKNPEGTKLAFGTDAWEAFTAKVKLSLVCRNTDPVTFIS